MLLGNDIDPEIELRKRLDSNLLVSYFSGVLEQNFRTLNNIV
jgi:hypothetical protein